jgi:hypothetical protein
VRARADESRTHRSLLSNLPLVLKTRTPTGVHPLSSTPAAAPINDCKRRPLHMPVHENLSAAIPACHASRSEASKLLPDQNTAKPPNTSSNSSIRRGMPSSPSPATPHDGGAIIWPGRKSGSQEAGGTLPPRLRGGLGRAGEGLAGELPNSLTPAQLLFPRTRGNAPFSFTRTRGKERGPSRRAASTSLPPRLPCSNLVRRVLRF